MELDHRVVLAPDGVRHARVPDAPVLLCGREPEGNEFASGEVTCEDCLREAARRDDDRSVGAVEA